MRARLEGLALGLMLAATPTLATVTDCQRLELLEEETGQTIVGVEDIAITPEGRRAYLAAYDRRARPPAEGAIHVLELERLRAAPTRLELASLRPDQPPEGGFRPHGLALAPDGDVLVVNRRIAPDGRRFATLDLFRPEPGALTIVASFSSPEICNPNGVFVEADGAWLVSNDRRSCAPRRRRLETWLGLATGALFRVQAETVSTLADDLRFANGVARTGDIIWVAETRGRRLLPLGKDPVDVPFAPDNLTVDEAGRLWAAGPVNLLAYAAFTAGLPGFGRTGSRVAVVENRSVQLVLDDDGRLISGATVAAAGSGFLLIGAAYETAIAYCRLEG